MALNGQLRKCECLDDNARARDALAQLARVASCLADRSIRLPGPEEIP
jgi:hypothetical protein